MKKKKEINTLSEVVYKVLHGPYGYSYITGVSYDYSRTSCNCEAEYCNCTKITNTVVESVDLNSISNQLTAEITDPISKYCINRLLVINELYSSNNWKVNVVSGYYGEEVHGCTLQPNCQQTLISQIQELENLNDIDKIKKILEFEYGFLLDQLKACSSVSILEVPLSKIRPFNQDYSRKVSKKDVGFYLDCKIPRAICSKNGALYAVIDGYHRMTAAIQQKMKTVSIIVLE